MNNGCICCTVRGDLIRILGQLLKRRDKFDYILVETTGLADPGPVAQTFFSDDEMKRAFRLDGIVTLVDAKHIGLHLEDAPEAKEQIAFADRILLNKTDLVGKDELEALENKIRSINALARIHRTTQAVLGVDHVLNIHAFDPASKGKNAVEQQTLLLQDRERNRTIPVDIYWSQNYTPAPLVVISHGFGANRQFLSYLAHHLASHGITVAAIEHPGSNSVAISRAENYMNLAQLLPATEFIERPKDVSFLLNELEKLNTQSAQLQGKLNTNQVTVIGHSLGGYTALALVGGEVNLKELQQFCTTSLSFGESPGDWLQCAAASLKENTLDLQDRRVQSAIALNPLVGKLFGTNGLTKIAKPVLILAGTEDVLTPALTHQIRPFNQLQGSKYLLTAIGGTHLSIHDPAYPMSGATAIVREKRGEETHSLRQLIRGVTLAFIKQHTPQAQIYQPFLTPAYAQSLSTVALPLRLNSDLPENIKPWLSSLTK